MKILIIRNFPSYMDVKRNTYNIQEVGLAKALVRKGHRCDIVFWTDKEEKDELIQFGDGYSISVFYRNSRVFLKNAIYRDLDDLIEKYDVIQPCEYNQLQSWLLAKKYPNKTVIFHGPYYSKFNKKYNALCRVMDLIVMPAYKKRKTPFLVKSHLAKKFLINKGISENQITTAGVGVDLNSFKVESLDTVPENILKINDYSDKLRLLYIGRLEPRRNIPFLFDVLKQVYDRHIPVELIMIGDGESDYCEQCFKYAEELGVYENIYHIKKAEQKYLSFAYQNADIFLLPTNYEIFGMVLLEAMYFGKKVITTHNGGSEMLIKNGEDGIIINDFDAAKWCDAVIDLIDDKEIGKTAQKKIEADFTWDSLCDTFVTAYQKRVE